MTSLGTLELFLRAEDSQINATLDRVEKNARSSADTIQKSIAKSFGDNEQVVSGFAGKVDLLAGAFEKASLKAQGLQIVSQNLNAAAQQINQFSGAALIAAKELDSAQAKVSTLSNDVDGLTTSMGDLAKELGYQANQTDLLNASYEVLSAGFSGTEENVSILRASVLGATGGLSDVKTVADATTTALSAFGLEASDAGRVVDILAETQNAGKITIDQYAQQLGRIASIAANAGVSLEEVSAAIALATEKGVPAESAVSGVRQAIVNLLKPTAQAKILLQEFGIENATATLKSEGLVGILQRLADQGATSDQLSQIFSDVDALATVATLAGDNVDDFAANIEKMNNSLGTAEEAAQKIANSFDGQVKSALNEANTALVSLGNGAKTAVVPLLKALGFLTKNFNDLPEPLKRATGILIALTGGSLALAAALAGVAASVTVLNAVVTPFIVSLTPLAPLLIAIAAGVAGIGFAKFTRDLKEANIALDNLNKTAQADGQGAISTAFRLKGAIEARTAAQKKGIAVTQEQIATEQGLLESAQLQLKNLKDQLAAAQALTPENEAQTNAQAALVAEYQVSIKALEGQVNQLNAARSASGGAATAAKAHGEAEKDRATSLDEVSAALQRSTQEIELRSQNAINAAKKRGGTEAEVAAEILQIEQNTTQQLIQENKKRLTQIVGDSEEAKNKRLEISKTLAQLEGQAIEQSLQRQEQAQQKLIDRLANYQKASEDADRKIENSAAQRIQAIDLLEAKGDITREQAAAQRVSSAQKETAAKIAAVEKEVAEIGALRASGQQSEEALAQRSAELQQQLTELRLQSGQNEIDQIKAVRDLEVAAIQSSIAARQSAFEQENAIQEGRLAGQQRIIDGLKAEQEILNATAAVKQAQLEVEVAGAEQQIANLDRISQVREQLRGLDQTDVKNRELINALEGELVALGGSRLEIYGTEKKFQEQQLAIFQQRQQAEDNLAALQRQQLIEKQAAELSNLAIEQQRRASAADLAIQQAKQTQEVARQRVEMAQLALLEAQRAKASADVQRGLENQIRLAQLAVGEAQKVVAARQQERSALDALFQKEGQLLGIRQRQELSVFDTANKMRNLTQETDLARVKAELLAKATDGVTDSIDRAAAATGRLADGFEAAGDAAKQVSGGQGASGVGAGGGTGQSTGTTFLITAENERLAAKAELERLAEIASLTGNEALAKQVQEAQKKVKLQELLAEQEQQGLAAVRARNDAQIQNFREAANQSIGGFGIASIVTNRVFRDLYDRAANQILPQLAERTNTLLGTQSLVDSNTLRDILNNAQRVSESGLTGAIGGLQEAVSQLGGNLSRPDLTVVSENPTGDAARIYNQIGAQALAGAGI